MEEIEINTVKDMIHFLSHLPENMELEFSWESISNPIFGYEINREKNIIYFDVDCR